MHSYRRKSVSKDVLADWICFILQSCIYTTLLILIGVWTVLSVSALFSLAPSLFLSNHLEQDGLVVQSDKPLPPETATVLHEARNVIAESELHQNGMKFRIYFCNSRWLYLVASCFRSNSQGIHVYTTDRIAIDMRKIHGNADLIHCIAHEATHSMIGNRLGWRIFNTPTWVKEGYAEYVSRRNLAPLHAVIELRDLKKGVVRADDYGRYWLLVSYALDVWKINIDEFLGCPPTVKELEFTLKSKNTAWVIAQLTGRPDSGCRHRKQSKNRIVTSIAQR